MPNEEACFGVIPVRHKENGWEVLLVKHNKGHWGFPKGHPSPNETPYQVAERELLEETGLYELDPLAVKVMAEVGIDISTQKSKTISELETKSFDYIITICDDANRSCPVIAGKAKKIHHGFDNPPILSSKLKSEDEVILVYRRIRDEIKDYVSDMPENLEATHK
jgi:arsenate reductase